MRVSASVDSVPLPAAGASSAPFERDGPTRSTDGEHALTTASPFTVRGVIEGFYGHPWTHEQRLSLIDYLAARV